MNRADPFFGRDAPGWQTIDLDTGRVGVNYTLCNNRARTVKFNPKSGQPEDTVFQDEAKRIAPQTHF